MEENVDKEFEKKDNDTVAVVEVIPAGISYQSKTAECRVSETMPCNSEQEANSIPVLAASYVSMVMQRGRAG